MSPVTDDVVEYAVDGAIARVTMNRPEFGNAQNSAMTYALDEAFYQCAVGILESRGAAEVDRISLDQLGIEIVLANDLAEPVADLGTGAFAVAIGTATRKGWGCGRAAVGADLLD